MSPVSSGPEWLIPTLPLVDNIPLNVQILAETPIISVSIMYWGFGSALVRASATMAFVGMYRTATWLFWTSSQVK